MALLVLRVGIEPTTFRASTERSTSMSYLSIWWVTSDSNRNYIGFEPISSANWDSNPCRCKERAIAMIRQESDSRFPLLLLKVFMRPYCSQHIAPCWYSQWDSNPHCSELKSDVSTSWTTGAHWYTRLDLNQQ